MLPKLFYGGFMPAGFLFYNFWKNITKHKPSK